MEGYVITNGQYYITRTRSGYTYGEDLDKAAVFPTEKKARNLITHNLPRNFRAFGYRPMLMKVPDSALPGSLRMQAVRIHIEQDPLARRNMDQVAVLLRELANAGNLSVVRIGEMMRVCSAGIEEENRIQEDLLHKMEFESGARGNGARLCAQMKACRTRRRAYKNLGIALRRLFSSPRGADVQQSLAAIMEDISTCVYRPRSTAVFGKEA